jgi:hypothetical protein
VQERPSRDRESGEPIVKQLKLKPLDIVAAYHPAGYRIHHFRIVRILRDDAIVARKIMNQITGRESAQLYSLRRSDITKILRRRDHRGYDIPMV